jgi:hypothetical protein
MLIGRSHDEANSNQAVVELPEKTTYIQAGAILLPDLTRDLYPAAFDCNSGTNMGF